MIIGVRLDQGRETVFQIGFTGYHNKELSAVSGARNGWNHL